MPRTTLGIMRSHTRPLALNIRGFMLAAQGDALRNDYPASDCPLGLTP